MILAVDTSIGSAVAIVEADGTVRAEAESENRLGHAETVGTLLQRALAEAGIGPDGVDHVAAGMGPGPFTGLRIGIAAARAFALGRGVPVVPVVSHDAAALTLLTTAAAGAPLAVMTDARRREVAVSLYDGVDAHGLPRRVFGPVLRPREADVAADRELAAAAGGRTPRPAPVTRIPAAELGRIAARSLAAGVTAGPQEPLYLRSPDVVARHSPKRVTA